MLPAVVHKDRPDWDRDGDLDRIRETYVGYDHAGRGRLWDTSNPGYARLSRVLRQRLLGEVARSLPPNGGRLLDLGCGTGDLIEDVAQRGLRPEWVGVDLRPDVIEIAQDRYPDRSFVVASADEVPRPAASFDVIVAQVLFSSLPSAALERAVAGEVERLLAPGGWLIWSDLRYANPTNPEVHGIGMRRLRALFSGWTMEIKPVGLLPPVARRLGFATGLMYPVLASVRPFRSHHVGRLRPAGGGGE